MGAYVTRNKKFPPQANQFAWGGFDISYTFRNSFFICVFQMILFLRSRLLQKLPPQHHPEQISFNGKVHGAFLKLRKALGNSQS